MTSARSGQQIGPSSSKEGDGEKDSDPILKNITQAADVNIQLALLRLQQDLRDVLARVQAIEDKVLHNFNCKSSFDPPVSFSLLYSLIQLLGG